METHATKLPVHSFCADVNARRRLEVLTYWISTVLETFIDVAT